ncbi:MAG: site-specific integrase [Candidatus Acidiferrales bacterium]
MKEGTALVEISISHEVAEGSGRPPALFLREARAAERFFDFFTANIRHKHTRRAYFNAAYKFSEFCAERGARELKHVRPVHVSAYIESLQGGFAKPTIKQHLAAIRMLYDWLVVGQIIDVNPAHAVRGPKHVVTKGRTPVLNRDEARALLSSIDVNTVKGLRDRALIAVMIYTSPASAQF